MNANDFQRNFGSTYFGMYLTEEVKQLALSAMAGSSYLDNIDFNPAFIYPASSPRFVDNKRVSVVFIFPFKLGGYDAFKLMIPWDDELVYDKSKIKATVPSTGMLQIGNHVLYGARVPIREPTQHGYAPHSHVFSWVGIAPEYYMEFSDRCVTWRVYNKIKFNWNEAVELINKGEKLGCVVDRFLALGIASGNRYTQIYYKRNNIGYLRGDQPILYRDFDNTTIQDYVLKLSGVIPVVM
jgi:hypothetical protein